MMQTSQTIMIKSRRFHVAKEIKIDLNTWNKAFSDFEVFIQRNGKDITRTRSP